MNHVIWLQSPNTPSLQLPQFISAELSARDLSIPVSLIMLQLVGVHYYHMIARLVATSSQERRLDGYGGHHY
jgi:hypothetical protein